MQTRTSRLSTGFNNVRNFFRTVTAPSNKRQQPIAKKSTKKEDKTLSITEDPKSHTGAYAPFEALGSGSDARIYLKNTSENPLVISSPRTSIDCEGFEDSHQECSLTFGQSKYEVESKELVKYSLSHIFQNLGVSQVVLPETISIGDDLKPRSELPLLNGGSLRDRIASGDCKGKEYDIMIALLDIYADLDRKDITTQDQTAGNILMQIDVVDGKEEYTPLAHDIDLWKIDKFKDLNNPNDDNLSEGYQLLMRHKHLYQCALEIQDGKEIEAFDLKEDEKEFVQEIAKAHPDTISHALQKMDSNIISSKYAKPNLIKSSIRATCHLMGELLGEENFKDLIYQVSCENDQLPNINKEDIPYISDEKGFKVFFKNYFEVDKHTTKRVEVFKTAARQYCQKKQAEQRWSKLQNDQ